MVPYIVGSEALTGGLECQITWHYAGAGVTKKFLS